MTSPYITTGGYGDEYTGGLMVKFESDFERFIFAIFILFILYWFYITFVCNHYSHPLRRSPVMIAI